jgi:hypothetical protein
MSYFYSNLAKEDTKKKKEREKNALMLLKSPKKAKKTQF